MKKGICEKFIRNKILSSFSVYYNKLLSRIIEDEINDDYTWEDMMSIVDPKENKGIEYLTCVALSWGVSQEDAEYFSEYIHEQTHKKDNSKERLDLKNGHALSLDTIETIMSFASVMSYAFRDKQKFYKGIKKSFEDYLLDLASSQD